MKQLNRNIFIGLFSVLISLLGALFIYYLKNKETELLEQVNSNLTLENKKLKTKISEYDKILETL